MTPDLITEEPWRAPSSTPPLHEEPIQGEVDLSGPRALHASCKKFRTHKVRAKNRPRSGPAQLILHGGCTLLELYRTEGHHVVADAKERGRGPSCRRVKKLSNKPARTSGSLRAGICARGQDRRPRRRGRSRRRLRPYIVQDRIPDLFTPEEIARSAPATSNDVRRLKVRPDTLPVAGPLAVTQMDHT